MEFHSTDGSICTATDVLDGHSGHTCSEGSPRGTYEPSGAVYAGGDRRLRNGVPAQAVQRPTCQDEPQGE